MLHLVPLRYVNDSYSLRHQWSAGPPILFTALLQDSITHVSTSLDILRLYYNGCLGEGGAGGRRGRGKQKMNSSPVCHSTCSQFPHKPYNSLSNRASLFAAVVVVYGPKIIELSATKLPSESNLRDVAHPKMCRKHCCTYGNLCRTYKSEEANNSQDLTFLGVPQIIPP